MTKPLLIIGAGGHGRTILDAALDAGLKVGGFVDTVNPVGTVINEHTVLYRTPAEVAAKRFRYIVGIGDQLARRVISTDLMARGEELAIVIDPTAVISRYSTIGAGTYIGSLATVGANASIGAFCILGNGSQASHDVKMEDGVQLCPGARLTGWVKCGANVFVGTGANVIPRVSISRGAIIGAGAAVTRDVPPNITVVGVPAKRARRR